MERQELTREQVEQHMHHLLWEGIEGTQVLKVTLQPGLQAGPYIQVETPDDVMVLPFCWKLERRE